MRCNHCNNPVNRAMKMRPRGTRYIILCDCKKCGHVVQINGVAGMTPPQVVK